MTVREFVTLLGFKLDDAPVKKYDKQLDATKEKTNKLTAATKGIGMAWKIATVAAAAGMAWISKNILEQTGQMEQYRNQLQKFTGDADSAAAVLAKLRDTSADPLFGTGNIVNAYKSLRNLGMEADNASNFVNVLGDIADGSTENFNALSSVLTKVSVSGKVTDGTIRQLTNAGFSMNDMAEALGKSTTQLDADIKAGKIGFNELTLAMSNATKEGGRFYQNMERQARTLTGSIKILKSTISDIGEGIGTKVLPKIVDTIRYITDLIKLGKEGFINFGAKAFEALIGAIQDVIIFFQILQMRMKKFGGAFTPLKALFADVFGFLGSVIESAYPYLMNLATLFLVAFKPIQAFVKPILESLKPIFKTVFQLGADQVGELIPIINDLTKHFEGIGKAIGKAFEKLVPVLENIKRAILAAFMPIKAFLKPIIESLQPLFEKVFGAIGRLFSKAGEDTNGLADIIKGLTPLFSFLGKVVAGFIDLFGSGIAWVIDTLGPFLKYILIIIGAIKAWSIVQGILNIVMGANPIGAIIMLVVALIAIIGLLVKNWDKVVAALKSAFEAIGNFFKKIWEGIKSFFGMIVDFIKKNALNILNIILTILFFPAGVIMAVVRLIIKHWETIKEAIIKIFTAIVNFFSSVVDGIKNIWSGITGFFSGLWEGVKGIAGKAWDGIKSVASKAWDSMKNMANQYVENSKQSWEMAKNIAGKAWDKISGLASRAWDGIKSGAEKTGGLLKNNWKTIAVGMVNPWAGGLKALYDHNEKFRNFVDKTWGKIKDIAGAVWDKMPDGVKVVFIKIKDIISGAIEKIKSVINGIKEFFSGLWEALKQGPTATIEYLKNAFLSLVNKIITVFRLIIKHWDKIKETLIKIFTIIVDKAKVIWGKLVNVTKVVIDGVKKVWGTIVSFISGIMEKVKSVWQSIWNSILDFAADIVYGVKSIWNTITNFFSGLWDGVKRITSSIWDGIKNIFFGVVDSVKNVWNGITGFFAGLWTALKQGPAEALEYIKNAFLGLFDSIKEKFLGFINVIKDGWDKVKGFFSGVKDGIVNVVTGGDKEATQTKKVNDLIVTPEGQYSTHPDDYIFAMKNPGDLIEALMRFLGGGQQMQPAYAGAAGSLAGDTLSRAAANHTNYNNSNTSNYSTITAPINVNVNASGMSPEAASAAVKRGVQDALNDAIHSSRGAIPSPEARRR